MNKIIKYSLLFFSVIFLIILSMFVFKLCPPKGNWPMPPWCSYGNIKSFTYTEISYLPKAPNPTSKQLDFGIGMMDIWGNPHVYIDLGDDTRKNLPSAMERINAIGSTTLLITDYALLLNNLSIIFPTEKEFEGNYNMEQEELNNLTQVAEKNNQKNIILLVNLMDSSDEISGFIKSSQNAGDKKEELIGSIINQTMSKRNLLSSKEVLNNLTDEEWNNLFDTWEKILLTEAKKANEAGIKKIIINPRDVGFDFIAKPQMLKSRYSLLAEKIKQQYNMEVGMQGKLFSLPKVAPNNIDFFIVDWDSNSDAYVSRYFDGIPIDDNAPLALRSLSSAWKGFFEYNEWKSFGEKPVYLLVTMPSYTNAVKDGWIEPGAVYNDKEINFKEQAILYESLYSYIYNNNVPVQGVISYGYWWSNSLYPQTKALRNDLSHSIRLKDAEDVFYKWSKVFNHKPY